MDWHGTRGGRNHAQLVQEITRRLDEVSHGEGTVGVLTHHLIHDESVWAFLSKLFEITASHPACRWRRITDLISR
jgi:hypothetical protein